MYAIYSLLKFNDPKIRYLISRPWARIIRMCASRETLSGASRPTWKRERLFYAWSQDEMRPRAEKTNRWGWKERGDGKTRESSSRGEGNTYAKMGGSYFGWKWKTGGRQQCIAHYVVVYASDRILPRARKQRRKSLSVVAARCRSLPDFPLTVSTWRYGVSLRFRPVEVTTRRSSTKALCRGSVPWALISLRERRHVLPRSRSSERATSNASKTLHLMDGIIISPIECCG